MAVEITVHHQYVPDWGPVDRFVPPTLQVQETADAGGGKPAVPSALVFLEADGSSHVYLVSEKMRQKLLQMLTGGIVLPGIEPA